MARMVAIKDLSFQVGELKNAPDEGFEVTVSKLPDDLPVRLVDLKPKS